MDRFEQQIDFILEVDKLKSIARRSLLINASRYENSAEHSWHFALMALVLAEYYPHKPDLDIGHVIKMALVHDIAEIDAGDTYCYDESATKDQEERENLAAKRIFALLPQDQQNKFYELWREFEDGRTHEARFARVLDRLNPFMLNYYSGGSSWKKHGVKKSQALKRMGEIKESSPKIWAYVESILKGAIDKGLIIDDSAADL